MALKSRNKISASFSMSSMTDIVFLLLIFFMLTSTFVTHSALDLILPKSTSKTTENQATSIKINKNIEYSINEIIIDSLNLEKEIISVMKKSKDPSILLQVDKSVDIHYVVNIMDIAYRNQYEIVIATEEK